MAKNSVILLKGKLNTLDYFTEAMGNKEDVTVVDVNHPEETLLPIADRLDSDTTVITFNNVGTGFELWRRTGASLYNILVDHPAFYIESIVNDYYPGYHCLCIDRGHTDFLRQTFVSGKDAFDFMPHGGIDAGGFDVPKDIDVLYAGSFRSEDEIVFAPLPFGNSEDFYDFIISFYETENTIEPQDAVNGYCKAKGIDYSPAERAILTQYVVKTVDPMFTALRRQALIRSLAASGISISLCGTGLWQKIADEFPSNVSYKGFVSPEECLNLICRSKVVINDLPQFADGAHERVFNGMKNGAVVMTNESGYLKERFTDKENILFWNGRDYDEAVSKVKEVLGNEMLRKTIRNNAYSETKNDSWSDRLNFIKKSSK